MLPAFFSSRIAALYLLIAAYIGAAWGLAAFYGATDRFSLLVYSRPVLTTTALILSLFLGWLCFHTMIRVRPKRLTAYLIDDLKTRWLTKERIAQALPLIAAFMLFISAFSSMKSMIPVMHAYTWDPFFYKLDRLLHFGIDPWRLLHPLLGYPPVTFIVNFVYNLWFLVMFAALYWQVFTLKRPELRQQFLTGFFLCWIVNGTLLAILLSSAGPCFYGRLFPDGADPYEPLMAYLQEAAQSYPVWARATQDMLWNIYQAGGLSYGSGISAMPSLHVSIAWLLVLFGYRVSKNWGRAFAVFFAFIMLGSVHLGWHYAIDGYLSVITTALIWWLAGRTARRTAV